VAASDVMGQWVSIPTRALCKRYQRASGADKAQATAVLSGYKQFLSLKVLTADFDDELLAPPPTVRAMWHQHVLDTAAYTEHCKVLCGRVIHHAPDADEDEAQRHRRSHRTLAAHTKHFPGATQAADVWDYGTLPALSPEEQARLSEEPTAKRARGSMSAANVSVSMQAPHLPLRTLTIRADASVQVLFAQFVDESGSTHLTAGRALQPPTTRLRCGNQWLHDLQTLSDVGVVDGSCVYVAVPMERTSRDQMGITIRDAAGGESATVYARPNESINTLMARAQEVLGVPSDAQQLIYGGKVLQPQQTLEASRMTSGATVQMVVGRRRARDEMTLSPGGTWR